MNITVWFIIILWSWRITWISTRGFLKGGILSVLPKMLHSKFPRNPPGQLLRWFSCPYSAGASSQLCVLFLFCCFLLSSVQAQLLPSPDLYHSCSAWPLEMEFSLSALLRKCWWGKFSASSHKKNNVHLLQLCIRKMEVKVHCDLELKNLLGWCLGFISYRFVWWFEFNTIKTRLFSFFP